MMSASLQKENKSKNANQSVIPVSYQVEMHRLIEQEAYLRASNDNFAKSPDSYWLDAESYLKGSY